MPNLKQVQVANATSSTGSRLYIARNAYCLSDCHEPYCHCAEIFFKNSGNKRAGAVFTQLQLDIQYIQTYSMNQRQYIAMTFEGGTANRYVIQKMLLQIYTSVLFQKVSHFYRKKAPCICLFTMAKAML